MSTLTFEAVEAEDRAAAEANLLHRFRLQLASLPDAVLLKAASLSDASAFAEIGKAKLEKKRAQATRNQAAMARMKASAFERVASRCELLDAREAYEILGITKQALSQKTLAGKLLAYTNTSNRRKFYPAFQFAENRPRAIVATLIASLQVEPADTEAMNFLVQHLVGKMDYSDQGQPENIVYRFSLLDDAAALAIIERDYRTAFEMGQ